MTHSHGEKAASFPALSDATGAHEGTHIIAGPNPRNMATIGTRADDSEAIETAPYSTGHVNHEDLCDLCLQALTIDDQLAGGAKSVNPSDGATSLELSGLPYKDWRVLDIVGPRTQRLLFTTTLQLSRDEQRWVWSGCHGLREVQDLGRSFCVGDQRLRRVTLPEMLEISESAVGTCRLCSRLRALFMEQYQECSWWGGNGSALHFTMQYEWSEWCSVRDDEDPAQVQPGTQLNDGLAVLVFHPGLARDTADVFQFDVVAWPGRFLRVLSFRV